MGQGAQRHRQPGGVLLSTCLSDGKMSPVPCPAPRWEGARPPKAAPKAPSKVVPSEGTQGIAVAEQGGTARGATSTAARGAAGKGPGQTGWKAGEPRGGRKWEEREGKRRRRPAGDGWGDLRLEPACAAPSSAPSSAPSGSAGAATALGKSLTCWHGRGLGLPAQPGWAPRMARSRQSSKHRAPVSWAPSQSMVGCGRCQPCPLRRCSPASRARYK